MATKPARIDVVDSPAAADRLAAARAFVDRFPAGTELLLLGATRGAIDELAAVVAAQRGATFGLHRFTTLQLAARLARGDLAARGLAHAELLAAEAIATRATFDALAANRLAYYAPVARLPGFGRALAATVDDLRRAGVTATTLAAELAPGPDLAHLLVAIDAHREAAGVADRAMLLHLATNQIAARSDALIGLPTLLLDVAVDSCAERTFLAALLAAAPAACVTLPRGDPGAIARPRASRRAEAVADDQNATSLARLRRHLFADAPAPVDGFDATVRFFSAPGEGRECVEIARAILDEARAGVRFDDIAILLRMPDTYVALFEAAFARAAIPAYFAHGTRRPDPAGRAFLALLTCATNDLSATDFAEYLSLAQIPEEQGVTGSGGYGVGADPSPGPLDPSPVPSSSSPLAPNPQPPAPSLWSRLLIDAAAGGGRDRWERRLGGLAAELAAQRAALQADNPESPAVLRLERDLAHLDGLRTFALPVIAALAALPQEAVWADWLDALEALAPRVLAAPQRVLATLAELRALGRTGPVGLDEVRAVLAARLTTIATDPPPSRYGRVFVGGLDDVRGRTFAVVFVPGLAERIFPQRPREDPLLLDGLRARLSADLARQGDRVHRERVLLQLGVGAATRRLYLSYPRVDVVEARPRVASFYGLDVARATLGHIPDVDAFERQLADATNARLAWPAPDDPNRAIDAMEHDLAVLGPLLRETDRTRCAGRARYLLTVNAHLGRSLRTRYARWQRGSWSAFDGLVQPTDAVTAALTSHRLNARPYSASTLERFARCPYQFYLAAIYGLTPRAVAGTPERLAPQTRGLLVHEVQARTLRTLVRENLLPLSADRLADADAHLATILETTAERYRDAVAPPIARVWEDEIADVRADLRTWLQRLAAEPVWQPSHAELGFGLPIDDRHDPASLREPVALAAGVVLRGSVDVVERRRGGASLRVTDIKTGAKGVTSGAVVDGGTMLQPVLYALAVEAALGQAVTEARLSFCTRRGAFAEHVVPLNDAARRTAAAVLQTIDAAIERTFLPPAPRAGACARCEFAAVCGPYEEERATRKDSRPLAALQRLRGWR